ncbi:GntR family transcriptional regulator [Jiangella sp. DSM 45060]|uniref:GntR family transcriptional regulator n=1 Tax=Jiangella sp. DSM 45060 TaxID=1798224 RepID=UPI00087A0857|nr:GntR family transcriptional regulator [Jiangella sp. DSM 45060]SDT11006.1 DNA-binding transcriptional regulator, GntR family [Jiangella sp. DSM 45060]
MVTTDALTESSTLPETVADWIERAIIDGRFPEGARIRELAIAKELEVSRAPVREALRILAGRGLVRHVPNVGAVSSGMSRQTVREVYGLRALIEADMARAAVPRLGPADVERMEELLAQVLELSASGEWELMFQTAWRWREILYDASGNRTALEVVRQLRARISSVPHGLRDDPEHVTLNNIFYRQATTAVRNGNAEAVAALVSAFLCQTGDQVLEYFRQRVAGADEPAAGHRPA